MFWRNAGDILRAPKWREIILLRIIVRESFNDFLMTQAEGSFDFNHKKKMLLISNSLA